MNKRPRMTGWLASSLLATAALFACALPATAQVGGAAGAGGGFGGGFGGMGAGGGFGGAGGAAGTSFGGGTAGTSMGGGLAGGTSGGISGLGFSGSTGGMTGTTGGITGGIAGGIAGGNRAGAGYVGGTTTATGPQTSNPFRATYANPYALGYAGATGQVAFGQPITGTTVGGGLTGQVGGITGSGGTPGGIVFASSYGVRRAPAYTTTLAFPYQLPTASQLQRDLQQTIDRSSALEGSRDAIRVAVAGRVAILLGTVPSAKESRLAEALVRLEPGVAGVQNQLRVAPPPNPP